MCFSSVEVHCYLKISNLQARRHIVESGLAEVRASAREGVRGISPKKIFDLWLPLCAFLMHFGSVFSRLGGTDISILELNIGLELSIQSQD